MIYKLEVRHTDPEAVMRLGSLGYDVAAIAPNGAATIYATLEEWGALAAAGFEARTTGTQPAGPSYTSGAKALGAYSSYTSLTANLEAYAAAHADIAALTSLGQSVQGRELWALLITDNPGVEEDEPEFKYIATMHGDEPVGTEMCLELIDRLLNGYGSDVRTTLLVDSTAIWIVPLMNPDGLELGTRNNANTINLNRSFPEYPDDYFGTIYDGDPLGDSGREPEVAHVMRWNAENSFVLSANFHTGALLVNYPYDHEPGIASGDDAPTPDDALMRELSLAYAAHNPDMFGSPTFPNGISNGSDWYAITGGMQDWNYRYLGCVDVTIELSDVKMPEEGLLSDYWSANEEAMLSYIEAVHTGLRGIVTDAATGEPVHARVNVGGNPQPVFSDPDVGDYYRLLLPGVYTVAVEAPGYLPQTLSGVTVVPGAAARLDVELSVLVIPAVSPWALAGLGLTIIALFVILEEPSTAFWRLRR
jgi:carboxypeptidase D